MKGNVHLSPAKDQLVIVEFSRAAIEQNDYASALARLDALRRDAATAMRFEGQLTFLFPGWGMDRREIWQIPEIRRYFEELSNRWGYWIHFCEKTGSTIPLMMSLLCSGKIVRNPASPGVVGWQFDVDTISPAISFLLDRQNTLCKQLGIDEVANKRIKADFTEAISAFLE